MGKTLQFNKDQNLSIEGAEYRVTGGIEFHNRSDGSRWWEYCLLETRTRGINGSALTIFMKNTPFIPSVPMAVSLMR